MKSGFSARLRRRGLYSADLSGAVVPVGTLPSRFLGKRPSFPKPFIHRIFLDRFRAARAQDVLRRFI